MRFPVAALVASAIVFFTPCFRAQAEAATPLRFESTDHWRLLYSPLTFHYSRDPDHKHVWLIGLEKNQRDEFVYGATYFNNSFGQPSTYWYVGDRFNNFTARPEPFVQVTAGIIYGYKGRYRHKVPLNSNGFSPGFVMSLGWQFNKEVSTQINVLGTSAVMWQWSWDLPP